MWDSNGGDHTDKLTLAINDVKFIDHHKDNHKDNHIDHHKDNYIKLILKYFIENFSNVSGFISKKDCGSHHENKVEYNGKTDIFWHILHNIYDVNVNRKLKIYTYGTNKSSPPQKGCQMIFDASILQGNQVNITEKTLLKMRGTNLILQQVIRTSLLFNGFINNIVENIKKNNYSVISIICKAGHHRSVACAEMLKNLYQNCTTTHLTIDL